MNYITKFYSGRIARKNYFFGLLFIPIMFFVVIIGIVVLMLISRTFLGSVSFDAMGPFYLVFFMLCFLVSMVSQIYYFSLIVRRNHDLGHTGSMSLLLFVPLVSFFYALYLLFARGNVGANQYGSISAKDVGFLDDFLNRKYDQSDFDPKIN